jgi:hypothetical protein
MRIVHYKNIVDSEDLRVYWKGNERYPAESIAPTSLAILKTINACRFSIEGARDDSSKYDEVFEYGYRLLSQILYREDIEAFLFKIEEDPKAPNRVRTFKGNFPKTQLSQNSLIENEIDVSGNRTLIASVVLLTKSNFERVISSIGNSRKAFIIQSSKMDFFSQNTLGSIVNYCLRKDFTVDYLKLLELMRDKLGLLLRMSGDGGDSSINVDVFYREEDTDRIHSLCKIDLGETGSNANASRRIQP